MSNPNPTNKFKKGDPRINRNGRPKVFDAYRSLVLSILEEPAIVNQKGGGKSLALIMVPKLDKNDRPIIDPATGQPEMVEHYATNLEMILRQRLSDRQRQGDLLTDAFGKAPMPTQSFDLTSNGKTLSWAEFVKQADDDTDDKSSNPQS